MALVKIDNDYVELRQDGSNYVIRTFPNIQAYAESKELGLILLLRSTSRMVELRSSVNGMLLLLFNDKAYIDVAFYEDNVRLVDTEYNAELRNVSDGRLLQTKKISIKPVSAK